MEPRGRRNHARIALSVDVDLSSSHNFFTGRTRNLSQGGLFIETDAGLRIGAEVAVSLAIAQRRFEVKTEVVWALFGDDDAVVGIGVRFLDPQPALVQAIDAFMTQRQPMPFEVGDPSDPPPKAS